MITTDSEIAIFHDSNEKSERRTADIRSGLLITQSKQVSKCVTGDP